MSTSRSALQLLRDEPTLVGVVLYLVADRTLRTVGSAGWIPLDLFKEFAGVEIFDDVNDESRWPRITTDVLGRKWVTHADLERWLLSLASDRSDFAPAVPRALPGGRA